MKYYNKDYKHTITVKQNYVAISDLDIEKRKSMPLRTIPDINHYIKNNILDSLAEGKIETLGELLTVYKQGIPKLYRFYRVGKININKILYIIERCFPEEMYIESTCYTLDESQTFETKEYWNTNYGRWYTNT